MNRLSKERGSAEGVITILVAVLVLGGVGYYTVSHHGKSKTTPTAVSVPAPVPSPADRAIQSDPDAAAAQAEASQADADSLNDAATAASDLQ